MLYMVLANRSPKFSTLAGCKVIAIPEKYKNNDDIKAAIATGEWEDGTKLEIVAEFTDEFVNAIEASRLIDHGLLDPDES